MRLIDRDSLKHQIIETYEYEFPTASGAFDEFVTKIIPNIINNAPTIDAVPVVRCRYCVKRHTPDCAMWYKCSVCNGQWSWENNDDFCSYGAKLEDKPCG